MKLRKLLVLALVLALFVCAFAACGDGTDTETNLPGTDSETDAPVSDTEDPGKETEDPGEECKHELEVEEKLATCTDRGYKKEVCKLCGEIVSETAYPKAAHTPTAAATCTEDSKCSVCGEVLEAAKGHTFGDVVVVDATCLADGSKTQTCSVCNETVVEKIPALAHDIQDVTASTAATCTTEGSKTGICVLCNQEQTVAVPAGHTFKDLGDLSALTFVNGKLQATCSGCNATVDVAGDLLLALNFDEADVPTELAKWDGFAYGLAYNPDQAGTVKTPPVTVQNADATDGHTSVLSIPHNASAAIQFGGSLLSDSDYYVISFDWRATKFEHTSNKVGGFGLADTSTLDTGVSDGSYAYAFRVDRSNGELYNGASKEKFSFVAEAGRWYHIDIVVDHETGTAYTYFDGVCVATLANAKWIIAEDGTYTWRFGGIYNVFHRPEFDNFTVVAINKSESSAVVDPEGGEEGGDPEDDGTGCDHECYLEVQLPTPEVPGFIKRTCNLCGRVVTYEIMTHICYSDTAADCVTDSRCDECGELIEAAWGHALDPNAPITETPADPACSAPGVRAGTCIICGEPVTEEIDPADHTFKIADIDLADLTFDENGNILAECSACGQTAVVPETVRLQLDFDMSLNSEVASKATATNGLVTGDIYQSAQSGSTSPVVDKSVLQLNANKSSGVSFNAAMLKDADYYIVSFDWRVTAITGNSTVIGVFGLSNPAKLGAANESDYNYALWINRNTGAMFKNGKVAIDLTATANTWYEVVIAVDNVSGYHYVYIDGTLYSAIETNGWLVDGDGDYTFRFGGVYNISHKPQFDNFKVKVLDAECRHSEFHLETTTAATCMATGMANKVCDKCGEVIGTQELPQEANHKASDNVVSESACAITYSCAYGCGGTVNVAKENAVHTVPAPDAITATTVIKNGVVQGTCTVCGLEGDSSMTVENRLVLDFDQTDLATEIAALNAANAGLNLSATNADAYEYVNSTLQCKSAKVFYLTHSGSILKDATYYVISFDWRWTNAQNDGFINTFGTATSTSNLGTSFAYYARTAKTMVDDDAATANVLLDNITKDTWYAFDIFVNNATGEAFVYINDKYVQTVQADSLMVEEGDTCYWSLNGASSGHKPQWDNLKIQKLGIECKHSAFDTVTVNEASCVAEGTTKKVCKICGEDLGAGDPIPMKPHEASANVVEEKSCYTVYACTGAADGCTETVNVAKDGATHAVSAPTTFDANTIIKDGKIQAACADCGLYFDAPITEDVRVSLDFDKDTLAAELAEANAAANLAFSTTDKEYLAVANANTRYVIQDVNGEKVLYTDNNTNSSGQGMLFIKYDGTLMADSSYYKISFDWRFGLGGQTGVCSVFSAYGDTTTAFGINVCKFDRTNNVFNNGVTYPKDDSTLVINTWYHFDIIINSSTGAALVYINDTYAGTVTSAKFIPAAGVSNHWRFGESAVGHKPQYDNFKVEVLAKTAVTG